MCPSLSSSSCGAGKSRSGSVAKQVSSVTDTTWRGAAGLLFSDRRSWSVTTSRVPTSQTSCECGKRGTPVEERLRQQRLWCDGATVFVDVNLKKAGQTSSVDFSFDEAVASTQCGRRGGRVGSSCASALRLRAALPKRGLRRLVRRCRAIRRARGRVRLRQCDGVVQVDLLRLCFGALPTADSA